MSGFKYDIVKYSPEYEQALLDLEKNATQGKLIQLEMLRGNYLSRSLVFEQYQVYIAINPAGEVMGVLAASVAPVMKNGEVFMAGSCYDVRVHKAFRGHGLTKKMGLFATKDFYKPNNVKGLFLTMKSSNHAVFKSAKILGLKLFKHPFYYLTIPTFKKINTEKDKHLPEPFKVFYNSRMPENENYFERIGNKDSPGFWHTHKMYHLRIRHMHPLIKAGVGLLNAFKRKDHHLPTEGTELKYSILFHGENCTRSDINLMLSQLRSKNISYLSVACSENSGLFAMLKPYAINVYPYILLSTFKTDPEDEIGLDVRCL